MQLLEIFGNYMIYTEILVKRQEVEIGQASKIPDGQRKALWVKILQAKTR